MNITQYIKIRDKKTKAVKKVVGCLAAVKKDDKVYIGWSKYAKGKESCPYCKETSRNRAIERATVHSDKHRIYDARDLPFAVQDELPRFVTRVEKYFKANVANLKGFKSKATNQEVCAAAVPPAPAIKDGEEVIENVHADNA